VLLKDHAKSPTCVPKLSASQLGEVHAVEQNLPRFWFHEPLYGAEKGALAGS
jgi:hypothetical protein